MEQNKTIAVVRIDFRGDELTGWTDEVTSLLQTRR
jgi:hypothetical protein